MKRFHTHISVDDLATSIAFYSKLFGQEPSISKQDYAKWMLDDPRVNFAISTRGHASGLNHFGLQVDTEEELSALKQQAETAMGYEMNESDTETCCYALSKKHWAIDPSGIPWEHFVTMEESKTYSSPTNKSSECCAPSAANTAAATHNNNQGNCC